MTLINTTKYSVNSLVRDSKTKIIIPNIELLITNAATNWISSQAVSPPDNGGAFIGSFNDITYPQNWDIARIVTTLLDSFIVGIGVTKIETFQDYTMPFSKGIGSTGEVIHLLGARNEIINLEFKTDRYPGRLGAIFRRIIQLTLEKAEVIYLVDDLFFVTPCLVRKFKIFKEGNYRGAVMGELELVSLSTGRDFWRKENKQNDEDTQGFVEKLKTSIKGNRSLRSITGILAVSAFAVVGALPRGIVNGVY